MIKPDEIGPDGYRIGADSIYRAGYPPIPFAATKFQHRYGSEAPVEILGWQFSTTFNRWSALVRFSDGWEGYTWPLDLPAVHAKFTDAENGLESTVRDGAPGFYAVTLTDTDAGQTLPTVLIFPDLAVAIRKAAQLVVFPASPESVTA